MSRPHPGPSETVPRWLQLVGSAVIAGHLVAVLLLVLDAPSGPWITPFGSGMAPPPQFAQVADDFSTPRYLRPLKFSHNYHFASNRVTATEAYFEVRLKDADGTVFRTVRFPDENANPWVRHRQQLLAQALTNDEPVPPPAGEEVAAPNQQVRTVPLWDIVGPRHLRLREVPEHLVPKVREVRRPSEWSLLLARAYSRHLCRENGAASADFVRHSREAISPMILSTAEPPPDAFQDLVADFGEFKP